MADTHTGNVIIVAAPSGGGKTSLVKMLVDSLKNVEVSVSHTTRKKRPGETDGKDYFFVDEAQFKSIIAENGFIEYAQVFNHLYGTSVAQINNRLTAGVDVVLDIDWQGAQQIRKLFPEAISIFILPPSLTALQERLQKRQQDNEQVILERMRRAQDEMSHYSEFDYLIVNDDFATAAKELQSIVMAHRLRTPCQIIKHTKLLSFLFT